MSSGFPTRPTDRAGADAFEHRRPFGYRQAMPKLGVDRAGARPIDPDRPQIGGSSAYWRTIVPKEAPGRR
jgi:hypothetical protein